MDIKLQLIIENKGEKITQDIMKITRDKTSLENLGLTLSEGKTLLSTLQKQLLTHQFSKYLAETVCCHDCGKRRTVKGHHKITYRTIYGKFCFKSLRLYECRCRERKIKSISPLSQLLHSCLFPELNYIQTKWASLLSYGLSAKLLNDFLPIDVKASSIYDNAIQVASCLENEMAPEKQSYIDSCEAECTDYSGTRWWIYSCTPR